MAISNVKTRLKNLEDILKQLNEEIRQKNETAAKIENDNVKKNAVIERKQNMVDQYNKRIEVMKNKDGVRILSHVLPNVLYTCSSHVESHIL
jgi:lipid II:glycine glycyltransferase (peptidoglycan interpeptide bridge formation enzyme)